MATTSPVAGAPHQSLQVRLDTWNVGLHLLDLFGVVLCSLLVSGFMRCVESLQLKWSQKTGQSAKVYPKPLKGYENGEAPEVYRPV